MKTISAAEFNFFHTPKFFIDVRAPIEFATGHLPGAINLPLLNDDERVLVGTAFKQKGSEAAIALGHRLISGEIKESRVHAWIDFLKNNSNAIIYCARGGLRSQISQSWILEAGRSVVRLEGGYKAARNALLQQLQKQYPFVSISGLTGSGKSTLIESLKTSYQVLDLEMLAQHRGSAFGKLSSQQPSQAHFENLLAVSLNQLSRVNGQFIFVEDESRLIGKSCLPEVIYQQVRSVPTVFVKECLESRVENILKDYVLIPMMNQEIEQLFAGFYLALKSISKKIGGLESQKILAQMQHSLIEIKERNDPSCCKDWISSLLKLYYDPIYRRNFEKRNVKILFQGTRSECKDYIKTSFF